MSRGKTRLPLILQHTLAPVQGQLLDWFEREGRDFPWRHRDRTLAMPQSEPIHDPYEILVSEVMLQQTQTARVVQKLPEFLERFPTVATLATAGRGDLLRAWQGMGYNRRALRLQDAAVAVVERFAGVIPSRVEDLVSLPGVGRYTANAVACFAFGGEVAVVDVNVSRVLSRLFYSCHTVGSVMPERIIQPLAEAVIPKGEAYRWHQALMDLGATICTARQPSCNACPLHNQCLSSAPRRIALFCSGGIYSPRKLKSEPTFRGEPRRIWRGRIVERLRSHPSDISVVALGDSMIGDELSSTGPSTDINEFLEIIQGLLHDGLIYRSGQTAEPSAPVTPTDRIRLPD